MVDVAKDGSDVRVLKYVVGGMQSTPAEESAKTDYAFQTIL